MRSLSIFSKENKMRIKSLILSIVMNCNTLLAQVCPLGCVSAPVTKPSPTPSVVGRPTVQVSLGSNLVTVLNAAKAGTLYVLAKGTYTVNGEIDIKAANVSVNLNGSTLNLAPSTGGTSNIKVLATAFEIYNGSIGKQTGVAFQNYSSYISIHDITSGPINQLYIGRDGSTHATLNNLNIGVTQTVTAYWTDDSMTISNSTFAGSVGEDCLRQDISDNKHIPTGSVLSNLHVSNTINAYNKEAIAYRMGSGSILNSFIAGYIRAGQNAATGVGVNVPSLVIQDNQFLILHSPQLTLIMGVNAQVISNTFLTDNVIRSIAIDGFTKAVLTNNIQKLTSSTMIPKGLWATTNTSNPPVVTMTGTVIQK